MRFASKRDWTFPVIWGFVFIVYAIVGFFLYYSEGETEGLLYLFYVWLFMGVLFVFLLKTTYYTLEDQELICHTMGFKKRIPYDSIKKVAPQKGIYAGLKINTSWRGLVISYKKWSEILISPADEEGFTSALKARCPNLTV
jgi:hypothetical protein